MVLSESEFFPELFVVYICKVAVNEWVAEAHQIPRNALRMNAHTIGRGHKKPQYSQIQLNDSIQDPEGFQHWLEGR